MARLYQDSAPKLSDKSRSYDSEKGGDIVRDSDRVNNLLTLYTPASRSMGQHMPDEYATLESMLIKGGNQQKNSAKNDS